MPRSVAYYLIFMRIYGKFVVILPGGLPCSCAKRCRGTVLTSRSLRGIARMDESSSGSLPRLAEQTSFKRLVSSMHSLPPEPDFLRRSRSSVHTREAIFVILRPGRSDQVWSWRDCGRRRASRPVLSVCLRSDGSGLTLNMRFSRPPLSTTRPSLQKANQL